MKQLGIAIAIASHAFRKKVDKGGQPYILHCLRVMNAVRTESVHVQCAAVLHDLLEDCPETWDILRLARNGFSEDTIRMVDLLTHRDDEPYEKYIKRIASNLGATAIKKADLRDNSDITRLKGLTKKDLDRIEKYHRAYTYLSKL